MNWYVIVLFAASIAAAALATFATIRSRHHGKSAQPLNNWDWLTIVCAILIAASTFMNAFLSYRDRATAAADARHHKGLLVSENIGLTVHAFHAEDHRPSEDVLKDWPDSYVDQILTVGDISFVVNLERAGIKRPSGYRATTSATVIFSEKHIRGPYEEPPPVSGTRNPPPKSLKMPAKHLDELDRKIAMFSLPVGTQVSNQHWQVIAELRVGDKSYYSEIRPWAAGGWIFEFDLNK